MRIEFNAGQLNGFSIAVFCEHSYQFEKSVDTVRDGFDNIRKSIFNMNGGVGVLQDAVDLVQNRIRHDETQRDHLHQARQKCADYLEEVKQTDHEVARLIRIEKYEFCKQYPHLVPVQNKEQSWWDKVVQYFEEKGKELFERGKKVIGEVLDWIKEKGQEVYDTIIGAAEKAVEWLVEQGKNIYESVKTVFEFIAETISSAIHAGVEFVSHIVETVLENLTAFVEFVVQFSSEALQKIIEVASSIADFVMEHLDVILDVVGNIMDIVSGISSIVSGIKAIIAGIGIIGASEGIAIIPGIVAIAGGVTSIIKGWDQTWDGIFGLFDYEPEGAAKYIFQPTSSLETWLNELAPGWHLGDIADLAGNLLSISSDIIAGSYDDAAKSLTKVIPTIEKIAYGSQIGAAIADFVANVIPSEVTGFVSDTWDTINTLWDIVSSVVK